MGLVITIALLGLLASVSPSTIVVFILLLATARARVNAAAFLIGWSVSLIIVFAVSYAVGGARATQLWSGSTAVEAIEILLGVALAVVAARQWRHRDRPRTSSGVTKKFTGRLKELNPWEAATVGVLEQPWTLTAAAVVLVRHHSAPYRPPGPRHQPHADDQRARHVERPLRGDTHGGCGGRAGETHREQSRQGAPVRPNRQVLQDRASTAAKRLAAAEVQTATAIQEGPEMVGRARLTERQPRMFAHWAWMPDLSSGYG